MIEAMTRLKEGFETNDIAAIQDILKDKQINILADAFVAQYLGDLLRNVRLKATEAICKPYKSIRLDFLQE